MTQEGQANIHTAQHTIAQHTCNADTYTYTHQTHTCSMRTSGSLGSTVRLLSRPMHVLHMAFEVSTRMRAIGFSSTSVSQFTWQLSE